MKTSSTLNFRALAGRITLALVLTALLGSLNVAPAQARDGEGRGGRGWHDNGRREHRGRGYEHRRREHRPYYYQERGYYAPPPVIYAPPPEPGIGIFLPPIMLRF